MDHEGHEGRKGKQMNPTQIIGGCLGYSAMLAFATAFAFFPQSVIRFLAHLLRYNYRNFLHLRDEQIPNLAYDKAGNETLRLIIVRGVEHPDEFPSLARQIRRSGCIVWLFLAVGFAGWTLWFLQYSR